MDLILSSVPWSGLGWGGLIFLAVLLIIRGDLVPRRVHESIVSTYKETIGDLRDANRDLRRALEHLANEHGTTADKVLLALPVVGTEDSDATS
ncbi:hypothetical protein EEW87_16340 [Janibacter melonis]|uniref:Uncharacterized protein n=1 Tax=Janibacter melonis TaxID=262209 RepID=A0A650GRU6_9MICO|nr:hypothetical protein [Janibacter melonis]QGX08240.1 hypothetical protein EEW87_16340 [Janibacter melonis]